MTAPAKGLREPTLLGSSPFVLFTIGGLLGMLGIGFGTLWASQRAGEMEAIAQVQSLTEVVANTVIEPNLTEALVNSDAEALERLDRIVSTRVIDDTTIRVKLWSADGRVIYSDEPRLIGEFYELDNDKARSLRTGQGVSEISSLSGPENRFEPAGSRLLEVYLPVSGPNGEPLLYESYFAFSSVSNSSGRIREEFAPLILGSLVVTGLMYLALAWVMTRHLRRNQTEREALLKNAIESSHVERRRIAADLHDGVVQDLVGVSFAITAAAQSANGAQSDLARDLKSAATTTRRSLQSLRSLVVDIYPPNLADHGLEAALMDLLAPLGDLGYQTDLAVTGTEPGVETNALIYRAVQESVRNAVRHADASAIDVSVESSERSVVAIVSDNGKGFEHPVPANVGDHLGLRLLSDLCSQAGGELNIESGRGRGTKVLMELPA